MRERKAKEKEDKRKGIQPNQAVPAPMNLPLPNVPPLITQPPPFNMPPNMSIPPPTALTQAPGTGVIPFPPPGVTSASSQIPQLPPHKLFDQKDPNERDLETYNSPGSIDHHLSINERQINMVEQQLSMIKQAQNSVPLQSVMAPMHPQAIFHPNQPNPMMFDMHQQQMMHGGQPLLDHLQHQQIPIFANPLPLLRQPPPMLPLNQNNLNPNIHDNSVQHYGNGRY